MWAAGNGPANNFITGGTVLASTQADRAGGRVDVRYPAQSKKHEGA
jgi:hypothetical protein